MDNLLNPLNHQDNSKEGAWFFTMIVFIEYTVSYLSPFSSLSVSILEAPLNRQSYRNGRRSGECKTGVGGDTCASVWTSDGAGDLLGVNQ